MSRINIPEVLISEENIAFYVIDICSGKEEESVPVRVLKRFSSLHRLHERLVSSNLICSVPFPSKTGRISLALSSVRWIEGIKVKSLPSVSHTALFLTVFGLQFVLSIFMFGAMPKQ